MNGKTQQLGLFVALIFLFGCTERQDNLDAYLQRVNARPERALPSLKLPPDTEPFSYTAENQRDPFSALPTMKPTANPALTAPAPSTAPLNVAVESVRPALPPPASTADTDDNPLPINPNSSSKLPQTSSRLEDYPISLLKLVGFIGMRGETFALVRTPTNAVHRVQIGDTLGKEQGEIVDMNANQIEIAYEEKAAKKTKIRRITLELTP